MFIFIEQNCCDMQKLNVIKLLGGKNDVESYKTKIKGWILNSLWKVFNLKYIIWNPKIELMPNKKKKKSNQKPSKYPYLF